MNRLKTQNSNSESMTLVFLSFSFAFPLLIQSFVSRQSAFINLSQRKSVWSTYRANLGSLPLPLWLMSREGGPIIIFNLHRFTVHDRQLYSIVQRNQNTAKNR